jgi:lipopolysaccharide/colanic/teichoic acid biosynthesis glycosyltransferase
VIEPQTARSAEIVPYPLPKRALDKLVAGGLLLALSPLAAVVIGAIGLDMLLTPRDRGRWLYREPRISQGRVFDILKFRTLREDVLAGMSADDPHARLLEADPVNLTWAARRVVKPWYLDELPQLVNVLRGDLSLVGPRPWPLSMVRAQLARGLDYRMLVKAGWTGPAQVRKTDPASVERLDLGYFERCRTSSSWQLVRYDLGILRQTLGLVMRGQGLEF